ncbi:monoacylglycerol lipase ABHD6-like [Varanus komodoensis]|uniref:monoacylglycerol lipase ABHD6-like n=1 Tax=Varanus komodoensis TaxID=61221 RepID=UPI001CF7C6A8|nr:monoacylglycerol lipase ABHD6-like [Varanus komodoensis]
MELFLARTFQRLMSLIVGVFMLTFLTIYNLGPSLTVFRIMIWYKHQKRGVRVKYAEHEGYRFCYFSRGEPGTRPSVLMLHGFLFNKDMWLNTIKLFPQDLHVVCLDMPGHGRTTRLLGESYAAADQAKKIHQFAKCVGLSRKPFHLVGISTGGMVAGVYAALYPSDVCALSLLCPAGLRYPASRDTIRRLQQEQRPASADDFLRHGLYRPTRTALQHLKGYLEDTSPHEAFFIKCFLDLSSEKSRYSLHETMSKIRAPTQIIWGKHDKVIDPSGAEILADTIPNSQVHVLEKCGHFIAVDRPKKSTKLLLEFYNSVCGTVENKM